MSESGKKNTRQLERYFKGAANHRRLDILRLLDKNAGLSLENIADALNCNFKTISGHTHRLVQAGLLNKSYRGREVVHVLSPYGKKFVAFANSFDS